MERFAKNKNVNEYEVLAEYYDELLQDEESLSFWLKYIEEKDFKTVLELASGSGVLAGILKKKGYDIIASDISKEMKDISRNNYDGEYLILDMIDYHLNKKWDLILCVCDSINYLNESDLSSFFNCAYEHLNDNGRLIFDMHSIDRLKEFEEQYIEEGYVNNTPYQWTISSDIKEKVINEHFAFYTKEGIMQENHTQHVFNVNIIKKLMNDKFKVRIIKDFIKDEKILVIGEKR